MKVLSVQRTPVPGGEQSEGWRDNLSADPRVKCGTKVRGEGGWARQWKWVLVKSKETRGSRTLF